jgi:hypothetical protein
MHILRVGLRFEDLKLNKMSPHLAVLGVGVGIWAL